MELIDVSKKRYSFTLYTKRSSCGLLFDTLEEVEQYMKDRNIQKHEVKNIIQTISYKIK